MLSTIDKQHLIRLAAKFKQLPMELPAIAAFLKATQLELDALAKIDLTQLTKEEQQLAETIILGYQNLISSINQQKQKVRQQIKALSNDKRGTMASYLQYQPQAGLLELTY